jgi:hypothetical protein
MGLCGKVTASGPTMEVYSEYKLKEENLQSVLVGNGKVGEGGEQNKVEYGEGGLYANARRSQDLDIRH